MDEREFLSGVNRKDERAWKELYDCFYAPLCCYSARILKDGTEAEDVVQDCLVKLWHSEVKFEDMKVITSYLYRAVVAGRTAAEAEAAWGVDGSGCVRGGSGRGVLAVARRGTGVAAGGCGGRDGVVAGMDARGAGEGGWGAGGAW